MSYRKNTIIAGILFLVGFAGGISAALLKPIMESQDLAQAFSTHRSDVYIGALGIFMMAFACTGIAVALYPALERKNGSMALGAVIFRSLEGVLHIFIGIIFLAALIFSKQAVALPSSAVFISNLLEINEVIVFVATIAWGIGAILYYLIFYQRKLIPAWLSLWGLAAMAISLCAAFLVFWGVDHSNSAFNTLLNIPIALQELILAGWLIVKGFNKTLYETSKEEYR